MDAYFFFENAGKNLRIHVDGALQNQSEFVVSSCYAPPQGGLRDETKTAARGRVQSELYRGPHTGHQYIFLQFTLASQNFTTKI